MDAHPVTVFGGTGFLGRRVVRALATVGCRVRVAARRPDTVNFSEVANKIERMPVDIRSEEGVRNALAGATAAVNAVSLYVEKGSLTFDAIHVEGATRVARCAREAGVQRLVHISGLGTDANSESAFVRARALGEQLVTDHFPNAIIVRPSVMFGCDDAFLSSLSMATRMPVVPLFGDGQTRLQPVYVDDVASAMARLATQAPPPKGVFDLGGGRVYTYRQAVQAVMHHLGRRRVLLPVPFPIWHLLTRLFSLLPNPPLTGDQVILMQRDNIVGQGTQTFSDLAISPRAMEDILDDCLPH